MISDREHIVRVWLNRAEHFWILSRVGVHEFEFEFPALHLHALAVELVLKTAILSVDPAGATYHTVNRRTFPEGHDVIKLIARWNCVCSAHKIISKGDKKIGWEEKEGELCFSEKSFEALSKYNDQNMVSRYFQGQLTWNAWAIDAGNEVFFYLRRYLLRFLNIGRDCIDSAVEGSCGRTKSAAWLSRALRKSNMSLPLEQRLID